MKTRHAAVGLVFCVLVSAVLCWGQEGQQAARLPTRHDYKVVSERDIRDAAGLQAGGPSTLFLNAAETERVLNERYGKDGWLLCAMTADGFVFCRPAAR